MKNNEKQFIKKITAATLAPVLAISMSSCTNKVYEKYEESYLSLYKDTFVDDEEFDMNLEQLNNILPLFYNDSPLVFFMNNNIYNSTTEWLLGYITYDNNGVYFYDVNRKTKTNLKKYDDDKTDFGFVILNDIGLPEFEYITLKRANELKGTINFGLTPNDVSIIDKEYNKEYNPLVYDLNTFMFDNITKETSLSKVITKNK